MIGFQLVVQHRAAGVLTSTNFNLDALVLINTNLNIGLFVHYYPNTYVIRDAV
jgi:hypothetical protein